MVSMKTNPLVARLVCEVQYIKGIKLRISQVYG